MRGTSRYAKRQQKRGQAIAYGCYLPDDEPNPLDLERDSAEVEARMAEEDRRERKRLLTAIKKGSKGAAMVGPWEATS